MKRRTWILDLESLVMTIKKAMMMIKMKRKIKRRGIIFVFGDLPPFFFSFHDEGVQKVWETPSSPVGWRLREAKIETNRNFAHPPQNTTQNTQRHSQGRSPHPLSTPSLLTSKTQKNPTKTKQQHKLVFSHSLFLLCSRSLCFIN